MSKVVLKENEMILGNKAPEKYIYTATLLFEKFNDIIIMTTRDKEDMLEFILAKFRVFGVKEIKRDVDGKYIKSTVSKLQNIQ